MLNIVKEVSTKNATDSEKGNVQVFLERLLIEVISENYRHFLSEFLRWGDPAECWPPLLANERQLSGLFAIGLSRVCSISRPEYSIERKTKEDIDNEDENTESPKKGRIDFMANFSDRDIALELKRRLISVEIKGDEKLNKYFHNVKDQAKSALKYMRESGFNNPVSIGLLIVPIYKTVTKNTDPEKTREDASNNLENSAIQIQKSTSANFVAYYESPREMQISYGWGKDGSGTRVYPGVVFAAAIPQRLS